MIKLQLRFMYWVIHQLNSRGATEGSLKLESDIAKELAAIGTTP